MRLALVVSLLALASCSALGLSGGGLDKAQTAALLDSVQTIAADNADLAAQAKLDATSQAIYAKHAASAVKLAQDLDAAASK